MKRPLKREGKETDHEDALRVREEVEAHVHEQEPVQQLREGEYLLQVPVRQRRPRGHIPRDGHLLLHGLRWTSGRRSCRS